MFQSFHICDTDQRVPSDFLKWALSLHQVVVQLVNSFSALRAEMILCYIGNHGIQWQQVKDPELAEHIRSKSLPVAVMEVLFAASKQNRLFRKQLEDYISGYLTDQKL